MNQMNVKEDLNYDKDNNDLLELVVEFIKLVSELDKEKNELNVNTVNNLYTL